MLEVYIWVKAISPGLHTRLDHNWAIVFQGLGLLAYAQGVVKAQPEAYKAQVDLNAKKGAVIHDLELKVLQDTIDARLAAAQAQAEAAAAQGEAAAPIAPEPELVAA